MQSLTVRVHDEKQLHNLAAHLARLLQPPCVLALDGQLGAGKTSFVQGFVAALQADGCVQVSSPTYALANSYCTQPVVHHLDLYRLDSLQHVWDLGLEELLLDEQALVCVEWPKTFVAQMAISRLITLQLQLGSVGHVCERVVQVSFSPQCPSAWYRAMQQFLQPG